MRNEEGRDEPDMWHAKGEDKCAQSFVKKGMKRALSLLRCKWENNIKLDI